MTIKEFNKLRMGTLLLINGKDKGVIFKGEHYGTIKIFFAHNTDNRIGSKPLSAFPKGYKYSWVVRNQGDLDYFCRGGYTLELAYNYKTLKELNAICLKK